jgi:glycosyltransferase involved in cell wall biosynthesis
VWLQRRRGGRLIHLVADLYPDLAIALGALAEGSWLAARLDRLYRRCLGRCDRVLPFGELMLERLLGKGVARQAMQVVSPWAVLPEEALAGQDGVSFRAELGVGEGQQLVMYSGNMGRCHPWQTVAGGIEALAGDDGLRWAFVGGGLHCERLAAALDGGARRRVVFAPYQPRHRLGETLAAGDIHLMTQDPRSAGMIVPSKLAGILAVGRPVLFVGPTEAEVADAIRRFECGLVIADGDVDGLVGGLRRLLGDAGLRAAMGENARTAFAQEFTAQRAFATLRPIIEGDGG